MSVRWFLAAVHLLGLAMGLGSIWARGRALRGPLDRSGLRRVFEADTWWGLSALVLISTGLTRLLMSTEKSTVYYMQNRVFYVKMALLLTILLLEIRPMVTFIRWRRALGQGQDPATNAASALATISFVQAVLLILMVFAATAMARGYWA